MNQDSLLSRLITWFAANPVAANLLMLVVIALGAMNMGDLRKEAFPSLSPNRIDVSVSYDSGSAEQTEDGLTVKLENALEGMDGVKAMTSTSSGSGVSLRITKQNDYDIDQLMNEVKSRLDTLSSLPEEAKRPVISKAQREEHAIWFQIYGNADRRTLQQVAQSLRSDLLANDNVSRVDVSGWLDPVMQVEVNRGRLQSLGLSLSDVANAINQASSSTTSATLKDENLSLQLSASGQLYLKQEFSAIPITTLASGDRLTLGEVANIRDTFDQNTAMLSRFNGYNSVALQVITTGEDDITESVAGAREVEQAWKESNRLPDNVQMATWYDRSESISQRLILLVENAITGIVLVFFLLALFLNLKVAFWVAAGLPFIFFGTLYFMGDGYASLTLNQFTTFGFIMALGIVVDDAVVVGESIFTERSLKGDTLENTINGTMRVAVPTLFGVFTSVAAFYSLSLVTGRLGELYSQFAAVVAICLLLSVVESKLILPAHLAHMNTHQAPPKDILLRLWSYAQKAANIGLFWFSVRIYQPLIEWSLNFRYAVLMLFFALFVYVIAMPFNGTVGMSFFPRIPGDTVRAWISMQNDVSFGQTHRNLLLMEAKAYEADTILRQEYPDSKAGIAYLQVVSRGEQSGNLRVELAPDSPYDIREFAREWKKQVGTPEGARSISIQSTRDSSVESLRVELRGNDEQVLRAAGDEMKQILSDLDAVSGMEDNAETGQPQLRLELTPQGEALGLTTDALARQLLTAFKGQTVQYFQRDSSEVEVRLAYPKADQYTQSEILNTRITLNSGQQVPVSSVATTRYGFAEDNIVRIDGKRALYLSAEVDKDIMSSTELVGQLRRDVVPIMKRQFPDIDVHFAGEAEQREETQASMVNMFVLALMIIYMLLAVPLRSYFQPLIIMTAIPFGVVGAILGHWMYDISLGILSLNGIIALAGVVVNDSLLLVSRYNDLKANYPNQLHLGISTACQSRLRAVLLTSLTTFAGLMPLLGETSQQALFLVPAAVSLAYGIVFATVITLILIPVLLLITEDIAELCKKLVVKKQSVYTDEIPQKQCNQEDLVR